MSGHQPQGPMLGPEQQPIPPELDLALSMELSAATQLEQLRADIDEIDASIVEHLGRRFQLTHFVGALKAQHDMPEVDKAREQEQQARFQQLAEEHHVSPALLEDIWTRIIDEVVVNHKKLRGNHDE